jgi:hypothetical protein
VTLALGLLVAQLGTGAAAGGSGGSAALDRLRQVTGAFHSESLALAAGYEADTTCVESPAGGMGIHYVHPGRSQDGVIDRDRPEALLYAPTPDGEAKLIGVEYTQVDADQNLETDDDRPRLFGQDFDGPMEGHGPGQPVHYDLHVWLWKKNPAGMFAPFNPNVAC